MALNRIVTVTQKLIVKGRSLSSYYRALNRLKEEMGFEIEEVAHDISRYMSHFIQIRKKRTKSIYKKKSIVQGIKNNVTVVYSLNGITVGIGNENFKQEFPYWKAIDVGGYIPPSRYGWFGRGTAPKQGTDGKQVFHFHSPDTPGVHFINPESIVEGMFYIAAGKKYAREQMEILKHKMIVKQKRRL